MWLAWAGNCESSSRARSTTAERTFNSYDTAGRLVATTLYHNPVNPVNPVENLSHTLHLYDDLGALMQTVQDLDFDGQVDLAGPDRISESRSGYALRAAASWPDGLSLADGWWTWQATITYPDGTAPFTNAVSWSRLTGLGQTSDLGRLSSESVTIDVRGNHAVNRMYRDRDSLMETRVAISPASTEPAISQTYNGLAFASSDTHGHRTLTAHDALRRPVATQDARGAVRSRGYDSQGRVAWESDPATNGTWFAHDSLGRRVAVTNAVGQVTHTAYDLEGRVIATWGATYPVAYEYSPQGRMVAMVTTRDPDLAEVNLWEAVPNWPLLTANCPLDRTRWLYDEATGLLTNKLYADGKGTAYSYTPDGKLATRTWARGVVTSYAYTNGSSLAAIDYSDITPDVAFLYDRLGRVTRAVTAGVSTNVFSYSSFGDPVSETVDAAPRRGIARSFDAFGRESSLALDENYCAILNYDTVGRVDGVAWATAGYTNAALYGYADNSDLSAGWTIRPVPAMSDFAQVWEYRAEIAAADPLFAHTRGEYDLRGLVGDVANSDGVNTLSRHRYDHDALGRRTARADSGDAYPNAAFDRYGYNARSEVTSGQRYHGSDTADTSEPSGGRAFGYAYDPIGNRQTATEEVGGETLTRSYTANALNQYTAIANPDAIGLRGEALSNATVTVNNEAVERDQPTAQTWPWHYALAADNADGPDFPLAHIVAAVNPPGTNDPDVVETRAGFVYAPPQAETLIHDDDGNLTSDGRYVYTWDGENRLIVVEEQACPTNRALRRVEYRYDHQSRRVARSELSWDSDTWAPVADTRFVYDGWNLIAERSDRTGVGPCESYYTWGLDLSGSRTGAGGINGLLAAVLATNGTYSACAAYGYDANGNVTVLASGGNTAPFALASSVEYDPFGRIVAERTGTGQEPLAVANRYRFSTKWQDPLTRLSDYGYRWYDAEKGRWMSRDPLGELGAVVRRMVHPDSTTRDASASAHGHPSNVFSAILAEVVAPTERNLCCFVENDPNTHTDYLGMDRTCTVPNSAYDCKCRRGSTTGKRHKRGYAYEADGCSMPRVGFIPPGIDNPVGLPGCSFLGACDAHDCCYGTCNRTKSACDLQFLARMYRKCALCGAVWGRGAFSRCIAWADIYFLSVVVAGGSYPDVGYNDMQDAACEECCCK